MPYNNKTRVILIARENPETERREFKVETEDICAVKLDEATSTTFVYYQRKGKKSELYQYSSQDVVILQHPVEVLNPDEYRFFYRNEEQDNVYVACHFRQDRYDYWTLAFNDHRRDLVCTGREIKCVERTRMSYRTDKLDYLERMAFFHGYGLWSGERIILGDHYQRMRTCRQTPLLDAYLSPIGFDVEKKATVDNLIFPFGINGSQLKAVKAALDNRVSIIQGPPGTGKTKTILNLIANLVIRDKTMLTVAGCNSATDNILEKMKEVALPAELGGGEIDLSFIIAKLGNSRNKQNFLQAQDPGFSFTPNLPGSFDEDSAMQEIASLLQKLKPLFEDDISLHRKMQERRDVMLDTDEPPVELDTAIASLKRSLEDAGYEADKLRLTQLSMQVFLHKLLARYGPKYKRPVFKAEDLEDGSSRSAEFLRAYPVVLSTAYSSKRSLDKDVLYDYLIMDEASQVDVATGALALSCAKNAVIVGDVKQLPNVIKEDEKRIAEAIFGFFHIPEYYNYATHNFLQSVSGAFSGLPETYLLEHYRCHPKIIGFCNQMFYDNKLVVMTEDHGEEDVLNLVQTVPGSHFYDFRNQREEAEIAAFRSRIPYGEDDIGIITPYNHQVDELTDEEYIFEDFEVGTIHKFQGREMPAVIISTVVDAYDDFVNNANLINVAVSRAQKHLILVTNGNEGNSGTVQALVEYIRRQHGQCVKGGVRSYFDLLCDRYYAEEREKFLSSHSSIPTREKASLAEKIIYGVICDILQDYPGLAVQYECKLSDLFDRDMLADSEEREYVQNPGSHVDFLIRKAGSGAPVLGIEVDGLSYHNPGSFNAKRNELKDRIFERSPWKILRLTTKFSNDEAAVIRAKLESVLSGD